MQRVVYVIQEQRRKANRFDVDSFLSRCTISLLLACTVAFFGTHLWDPLEIITRQHFTWSQNKYAKSMCWVKGIYLDNLVPFGQCVPFEHEGESFKKDITYYQWVPVILLLQAVAFYLPTTVWKMLNSKSGVDTGSILCCARKS